jgi:hypothetical protein
MDDIEAGTVGHQEVSSLSATAASSRTGRILCTLKGNPIYPLMDNLFQFIHGGHESAQDLRRIGNVTGKPSYADNQENHGNIVLVPPCAFERYSNI